MATHARVNSYPVASASSSERAAFIRRTYLHLAGAVAGFITLETFLIQSPLAEAMMRLINSNRYGWFMLLGAFMLTGWMARSLASSVDSAAAQYAGLALYVVAEAVIFVPILYIAVFHCSKDVLPNAAILTGLLFAGLTTVAFTTRKDFSFLGGILTMGGFIALGLIVCSIIFGFSLGLIFSGLMVGLASGAILYDTSKIIRNYRTDQHVAAALQLFASVALLFWYILRIFMRLQRR